MRRPCESSPGGGVRAPGHDRQFWVRFAFLCAVLAISEAARGIVVATLSLYVAALGGSSLYLSALVAAFSVGRLLSSIALGYASEHFPLRTLLLASLALALAGHVLFILPPYLSWLSPALPLCALLLARLLTGFATGTLSLARAFTSAHTAKSERTRFMSWLGIVQFAGYAFTPILGGIPVQWTVAGSWVIDTFVAGTYVLLLLDALLMAGLWYGMREEKKEEEEAVAEREAAVPSNAEELRVDVAEQSELHSNGQRAKKAGYATVDDGDVREEATEDGEEERVARELCATNPDVPTAAVRPPAQGRPPARSLSRRRVSESIPRRGRSERSPRVPLSAPSTPSGLHDEVRFFSATVGPPRSSTVFPAPRRIDRRLSAPAVMGRQPSLRGASFATVSAPLSGMRSPEPPSLIQVSWRSSPLFTPLLFVCLNATCRGCLAVAETYGSILFYTTVYGRGYDPATVSPTGAAWFFTILGGVGVLVFVLLDRMTRYLTEPTLLCVGFIAMCVGFVGTLDFDHDESLVELSLSMAMVYCVATPMTQTLVASMLSKALPSAQQGRWMGLLTAAGSVGRIVFPLLAGALYALGSTNAAMMMPAAATMMAVLAVGLGMRAWQGWWAWMKELEGRAEGRVGGWWRARRVARREWDERNSWDSDDDDGLDDAWLTIDEAMARIQRRARVKHRRLRAKGHRMRTRRPTAAPSVPRSPSHSQSVEVDDDDGSREREGVRRGVEDLP